MVKRTKGQKGKTTKGLKTNGQKGKRTTKTKGQKNKRAKGEKDKRMLEKYLICYTYVQHIPPDFLELVIAIIQLL